MARRPGRGGALLLAGTAGLWDGLDRPHGARLWIQQLGEVHVGGADGRRHGRRHDTGDVCAGRTGIFIDDTSHPTLPFREAMHAHGGRGPVFADEPWFKETQHATGVRIIPLAFSAVNVRETSDRDAYEHDIVVSVHHDGEAPSTSSLRLRISVAAQAVASECTYEGATRVEYEDALAASLEGAVGDQCICENTCANSPTDRYCDDGGPGSQYSYCGLGTDCADCGPAAATAVPSARRRHAAQRTACRRTPCIENGWRHCWTS